ncbi:sigma-54 factor interaction domain-containing protein, partial [bacterium]|nr:sigma-54 factor interaction domain-containing protein [bacterium]
MKAVLGKVRQVAGVDATVLITGESGSGKEVVARLIHEQSGRKKEPFVAVNCASFPGSLMEVELFGYEKGAFTGANLRHRGLFEQAHGGTLLLDEIAELDMGLQAKFLRV